MPTALGATDEFYGNLDIDLRRHIGQMFLVGFVGQTVSAQLRSMVEEYYIGSIIISRRNIRDVEQIFNLIQELQLIARASGYSRPLLIAVDQENGMVSRFSDGERATQFPGAMALAATQSPDLIRSVAEATAKELRAVGIQWNWSPVLDVNHNPLRGNMSVRAYGDNPQEVARFGVAFAEGLRAGNVAQCMKHFPGHGSTQIDPQTGFMRTTCSRDALEDFHLIPFRRAASFGIDSINVALFTLPNLLHEDTPACLSPYIIQELLRRQLGYDGVVVSDCLGLKPLRKGVGVAKDTVAAARAGCDIILVCHSLENQKEAIHGMLNAVSRGEFKREDVFRAAERVSRLKERYLSWDTMFAEQDCTLLARLKKSHQMLSKAAYCASLTLIRDLRHWLPISSHLTSDDDICLLTPVVKPLSLLYGNIPVDPFETLGKALAARHPRVRHSPYTSHGITANHCAFIKHSAVVILVTSNALKNREQLIFADHVAQLAEGKPVIALAACDPCDLIADRTFPTYVCMYEYTAPALETAAASLFDEFQAQGVLPLEVPGSTPYRLQHKWQIDIWDKRKDLYGSIDLWKLALGKNWPLDASSMSQMLDRPNKACHFAVHDPKTSELLGLCATYIIEAGPQGPERYLVASLAVLIVHPV